MREEANWDGLGRRQLPPPGIRSSFSRDVLHREVNCTRTSAHFNPRSAVQADDSEGDGDDTQADGRVRREAGRQAAMDCLTAATSRGQGDGDTQEGNTRQLCLHCAVQAIALQHMCMCMSDSETRSLTSTALINSPSPMLHSRRPRLPLTPLQVPCVPNHHLSLIVGMLTPGMPVPITLSMSERATLVGFDPLMGPPTDLQLTPSRPHPALTIVQQSLDPST